MDVIKAIIIKKTIQRPDKREGPAEPLPPVEDGEDGEDEDKPKDWREG